MNTPRQPAPQRPAQRRPAQQRPAQRRPDARTFRRRRIAVLLILLILIAAVVAGVWALTDRLLPAAPDTAPTSAAPSGPSEDELANPTECEPGALAVSIDPAADSLPAGQAANLPITIRNDGELPCLVEVGRSALTVTISSGDDLVWSSAHCGQLPEERRILLDTGASDTTVVAWSGTRSAPQCPGEQPKAKAGTYRAAASVVVGNETVEEEQVFGLH